MKFRQGDLLIPFGQILTNFGLDLNVGPGSIEK